MPNGGYPLHLLLPVSRELAVRCKGTEVTLQRREEPRPGQTKPHWTSIGAFTDDQLAALLFHLSYWGGNHDDQHRVNVRFLGTLTRPQYQSSQCHYGY